MKFLFLALPCLLGAVTALGGVYLGTVDCTDDPGSPVPQGEPFCRQGRIADKSEIVTPFGITHPLGYDGTGGALTISICVGTPLFPSPELVAPTQRAIATWNDLAASSGQCQGCLVVEEAGQEPSAPTPYHAESVILHELGHCAIGLGHPNMEFDPPGGPDIRELTSFTSSYGGSPIGIMAGVDGIRGSLDDIQQAKLGKLPESVHWFRISDNDPVVIDSTIIDSMTYSRSITANLPAGHNWSANANRLVAESLGAPSTHAVMYSTIARGQVAKELTADEVNMAKMARAGMDRLANTPDDYTLTLEYVADCAMADIEVIFIPNIGSVGGCSAVVDYSFPQPNPFLARHYSVVKPPGASTLTIALDSSLEWDFTTVIFGSGFESGDLSEWDAAAPLPE